jgi:molybdenum-dependent DNA-binding transcriptional regulator ModE
VAGQPGQARGLAQITDFGNQILAAFDTLAGQLTPANALQIATEADKLVAHLNDPNAVYQAKKGKDAEALASFKTQAQQKAAQLKAAAAELARQTPVSTGNPQANPNASFGDSQIPTGVLYAIGGIAVFYFLTRK